MGWSDKLITGIESIDNQHKMLFKMADDFRESLEDNRGEGAYSGLLISLYSYTQAHFSMEEKFIAAIQHPLAERNKEEHSKFIEVISGYQDRYTKNGYDRKEAYSLLDTVNCWLEEHISNIDMQLLI